MEKDWWMMQRGCVLAAVPKDFEAPSELRYSYAEKALQRALGYQGKRWGRMRSGVITTRKLLPAMTVKFSVCEVPVYFMGWVSK